MVTDEQIRDEKLRYDINRKAAKISVLSLGKIDIYMNTLQVKKYCFLIKVESQNKLRLLITLQEKFLNNKEKQLKSNQKKKKNQLNSMETNQLNLMFLLKNIIMILKKIAHHFWEKKKHLINLLKGVIKY